MKATALKLTLVFAILGSCVSRQLTAPENQRAPAQGVNAAAGTTALLSRDPNLLTVTSWNMKHLGREIFASAQASPIFADADISALQEVNTSESGLHALQDIAQRLSALIGDRICMGLSEYERGAKERYAYLWKNSRIAYVKSNGEVLNDCPSHAITIHVDRKLSSKVARPPAMGMFYFKHLKAPFVLAAIHLSPAEKRPQHEVSPLFRSLDSQTLPLIVAGDFNLDSDHKSFKVAHEKSFVAAMEDVPTSLKKKERALNKPYDNFWFRGLRLVGVPRVINLYEAFPEKSIEEVYNNYSDHCPITGQFSFPKHSL